MGNIDLPPSFSFLLLLDSKYSLIIITEKKRKTYQESLPTTIDPGCAHLSNSPCRNNDSAKARSTSTLLGCENNDSSKDDDEDDNKDSSGFLDKGET